MPDLVAGPGQILHATYVSADRTRCDTENVLTYNLGTGAIRAAATHGLLLERSFGREDGPGHRYRYELAPRQQLDELTTRPFTATSLQ